MKTRIVWFLVPFGLLIGGALGQEIEDLRPQVRFSEDFERFAEGSSETGSAPVEDRWQIDPTAGSVGSQIGEDTLSSKHLVMAGGEFAWVSPWITVDNLRLARVMLNLTAHSKMESGSNQDHLSIYASTRQSDRSMNLFQFRVFDSDSEFPQFSLQLLRPGKTTLQMDSLLGELNEAEGAMLEGSTEIQLIVKTNTASGSIFAIDDIKVLEERYEGMLAPKPDGDVEVTQNGVQIFPLSSVSARLEDFPIPAESNAGLAHVDFSVSYRRTGDGHWGPANEPLLDPASIGDDDLILNENDDVRFEFLQVEENTRFLAHYRMHRPAGGWESLPTNLILNTRDGSLHSVDKAPFRGTFIGSIDVLPPNVVVSLSPAMEPISQEVAFVDMLVRFTAYQAIELETLGDDDMYVSFGSSERLFATLQEVQSASEDGKEVTATYRFNRPAYGWPLMTGPRGGPSPYALSPRIVENATNPNFAKYPSAAVLTEAGDDFYLPVAEAPHIRMTVPQVTQTLSMTADQFEIDFVYASDSSILLDSIGDGDVYLYQSGQAGRLVQTTSSEDGLEVTARFAFDRDLEALQYLVGGGLFGGGGPGIAFPTGAVEDEAGNTNLAQTSYGRGRIVYTLPPDEVTATFQPKSQFHNGTRSYRFVVRYRSDRAPIRLEDFEQPHLRFSNGIEVRVETAAPSEDGHQVDVSYVATPKEGEWLASSAISLASRAIRNLEGGSHSSISLVTLGAFGHDGEPLDTSGIELVGGHLIEGDPATHRLAFLTNSDTYQFDQAILLFGGRSSMFAAFEESKEDFPTLVGRLLAVESGIATFELDRPAAGWRAWQANRLPYSLHLGTGDAANGGFITAGHVTVHSPEDPLPLLFSFEEWVKRLEKQADLPDGSLEGDADGDGVDSVLEYAMGSDLTDIQDQGYLIPTRVTKSGQPHLQLTFTARTNSIGLQAEIQHSVDGIEWQSADENFEVLKREVLTPEVESLTLCSKEPLEEDKAIGLFRIAVKH